MQLDAVKNIELFQLIVILVLYIMHQECIMIFIMNVSNAYNNDNYDNDDDDNYDDLNHE